ncbi:MAG TPA: universal stress protein [Xanthobacteraceae bacterium]
MFKDLVVNLSVGDACDAATDFAVSIASAFEAHLTGIAFTYDPVLADPFYEGMTPSLIDALRSGAENAAKAAVSKFEEAVRRAGVAGQSRMLDANFVRAADRFGRIARRFDLSVITQAEPHKAGPEGMIIEGALFESGRPVLVVPYIQTDGLALDRVMVGWDGSRNAARAAADAMPFLRRAKRVDVVTISGEHVKSDELPGADIAHHLARHGLQINLERIVAIGTDVANTMLSYAADADADLIVMGGYGHSRLREFVLGGATRGILAAMTVPVLMSH